MRKCTKCGADKPTAGFSKGRSRCKACESATAQARYAAQTPAQLEAARRVSREKGRAARAAGVDVRRVRQTYIDKLRSAPCVDCGGTFHPHAMDFDHVRGEKLFHIRAGYVARPDFLEELAKCDLRCANCHRTRHAREYERQRSERLSRQCFK